MGKITNTFEELLLLQTGRSIGNIRPYRLKAAPNFFAGFECLTAHEAVCEGKNKGYKHLYKVRRTLMRALKEYARRLLEEWFLKLFKQFNRTEYGKEETGNV